MFRLRNSEATFWRKEIPSIRPFTSPSDSVIFRAPRDAIWSSDYSESSAGSTPKSLEEVAGRGVVSSPTGHLVMTNIANWKIPTINGG